nr:MAG TPA: Protein of unknown function (DUF2730) [Caudoviricetes sp.]
MSEALFKLLTGIGGLSGVAALVICWMAYRLVTSEKEARTKETEERKNLTRKVDELETEKFTKLENKVDAHIKEDRSQEILNELKHLTGSVSRMADKFERVTAADAEQKAKIENHDLYLRNLNEIVTGHINNHKK